MEPQSPLNKLPPVVLALGLAIIGIEAVFQLAEAGLIGGPRAVGWRLAMLEQFGYSGAVLARVLEVGDTSFQMLRRFVTYPFINHDLTQAAFCAALTLALGKFVGEFYGGTRVAVIYFATAIIGAVIYGMFVTSRMPLIGGYTPVYGLIGAYTYALWLRLGEAGENQLRAFQLIGFLLGLQLLFGLIFGAGQSWIAELAAFFTGFAMSLLLAPGGWSAFLARMRDRG